MKPVDINTLERRARERDARARTSALDSPRPRDNESIGPVPTGTGPDDAAGRLVRLPEGGCTLAGRPVAVGDVLELYTNHVNGWIRGRFEWRDGPRFAVNLWNPSGPLDEDGLPPWVGDLDCALPADAVLRWPSR